MQIGTDLYTCMQMRIIFQGSPVCLSPSADFLQVLQLMTNAKCSCHSQIAQCVQFMKDPAGSWKNPQSTNYTFVNVEWNCTLSCTFHHFSSNKLSASCSECTYFTTVRIIWHIVWHIIWHIFHH